MQFLQYWNTNPPSAVHLWQWRWLDLCSLPRLEIIPSVSSAFHLHSSITCQHNYITSRSPPVAAILMMHLMLCDDVFSPVAWLNWKKRPPKVFLDPRSSVKLQNRIVLLQKCMWPEVNSLGGKSSEEKLENELQLQSWLVNFATLFKSKLLKGRG